MCFSFHDLKISRLYWNLQVDFGLKTFGLLHFLTFIIFEDFISRTSVSVRADCQSWAKFNILKVLNLSIGHTPIMNYKYSLKKFTEF